MESERYKRKHMQKIMEILDQDIKGFHEDFDLKQGYELTVEATGKEIISAIEKVSSDDSMHDVAKEVAEKAARFWVESGVQWYRLQFKMSSDDPSISQLRGNSSEMVESPKLRRTGNSEGIDYDGEEVVDGCEGKFVVLEVTIRN
jgi:hypothetical protein